VRKFLISSTLVVTAVLVALAASASGGSSSSSGQSATPAQVLAKARAAVTLYRKPIVKYTGPTKSPGKIPKGKSVVTVTCGNAAPLCLRAGQSVVEAAKVVGWSGKVVDGKNNPATWNDAVNTAVTSKASAIAMNSSQPSLVPAGIAKAKQAGIPVMGTLTCNPPQAGVVHQFESNRFKTGYVLGQWVIAHAPNGGEILEITSPEFRCLQRATKGFEAAIKTYPKLKIVQSQASPISDTFGPAGPQRMQAMFRAHPKAKFFWMMSESWAGMFQQGIDGDFFIPQVRSGAKFVMAGPDTKMYGYWVVDGLIRFFNHKPQLKENIPFRIIDTSNAKSVKGDAIKASFDFRGRFKKLWKVR
jgi:ribose transport system substrate-binding protein